MTVTVAAAVQAIRDRLDEPVEAQWEDRQLRSWLNEGIRDIARRTRLYTGSTTIAVSANDGEYTLASNIIAIEHILWKPTAESDKRPLEARAFGAVKHLINETGADPIIYTTYGHPPTLTLNLFPVPTRDGTLYVYGPMLPTALDVAGGTGNIDVIEGWLEAAYDYCEYMAQRKDKDNEAWRATFELYMDKVNKMIELSSTDDAMGEFVFTGTSVVPRWLSDFD